MAAPASRSEILDVNRRYHDVAAREYDAKWGISFAANGREQVVGKLAKLLGARPGPFAALARDRRGHRLLQPQPAAGRRRRRGHLHRHLARHARASLEANAARLGLDVETAACDAAALPFEDETFDLVFGHAVLHHLPELERSFAEFHRVLRPGGTLFFAGEPSRQGDRIAALPQARRVADLARLARRAARAAGAAPQRPSPGGWGRATTTTSSPRSTCTRSSPADLERHAAGAGFERVRVRGEELLANWFGWFNRTLEASADPKQIPMPWIHYAHRGYLLLQGVDRRLLEGRLPAAALLQLDACGHQAHRLSRRVAGPSSRRARSRCSATAGRSWTRASGPSPSSPSTRSPGWRPPPPSRSRSSS